MRYNDIFALNYHYVQIFKKEKGNSHEKQTKT